MQYNLYDNYHKQSKIKKFMSLAINSIFIAFLLTIIVALLIGFRPVQINGGSMLPTLDYGDVIIIYKAPKSDFKVGDILTYKFGENGGYVTHRIIDIDENGDFWTQGDNPNNSADGYPISYNYETGKAVVVGKTIYMLKGPIFHWLINIPNLICLFAGIVLLKQTNNNTKELFDRLAQYL